MISLSLQCEAKTGDRLQVSFCFCLSNYPWIQLLDLTGLASCCSPEVLKSGTDRAEHRKVRIGMHRLGPCRFEEQLGNFKIPFLERTDAIGGIASIGIGLASKGNLQVDFCFRLVRHGEPSFQSPSVTLK